MSPDFMPVPAWNVGHDTAFIPMNTAPGQRHGNTINLAWQREHARPEHRVHPRESAFIVAATTSFPEVFAFLRVFASWW